MTKIEKKNAIYLSLGIQNIRPSYGRSLQLFKTWNFWTFFLFLWVIFALLDPDSDSGPGSTDLIESGPIQIRNNGTEATYPVFRIQIHLSLSGSRNSLSFNPDPDQDFDIQKCTQVYNWKNSHIFFFSKTAKDFSLSLNKRAGLTRHHKKSQTFHRGNIPFFKNVISSYSPPPLFFFSGRFLPTRIRIRNREVSIEE